MDQRPWFPTVTLTPQEITGDEPMTQGIHDDEKPTAFQQSDEANEVPHGAEGHKGFRCYQCAQYSEARILLADNSGEYWQNLQLNWQEKCDVLQNKFDNDVATHWPNHKPIGCDTCPVVYPMPTKPIPPAERAIAQRV